MLAVAFVFGSSANADVLNFDSLTRGSTLTDQLVSSGILVSGSFGPGNSANGYTIGQVLNDIQGDVGVLDFGGSVPNAILYGIVGDQLNINFVRPDKSAALTDFASLRLGDGDASPETFRVSFLGLGGVLLSVQEFTTTSGPRNGGVTVSYKGAGINRIEILGIGSGSGGAVDDLNFNTLKPAAVPEPSSFIMLGTGAMGLFFLRRRSFSR